MSRHEAIKEAVAIAEAGMDPMRWLTSQDSLEVLVMQAVAGAVHERRAEANS